MIRINAKARLACIAVTFLASTSAQTGAWTPPVVLSTGGQGWEAAAAIDGTGNSVALWDERTTQDQIWSRSKTSGRQLGVCNGGLPATPDNLCFSCGADQHGRIRYSSMER